VTSGASRYPLGRRIAVFGKGGKTTLSKALAERYGLEFVELDELKHQANWTELPVEEHREAARERFDQAERGWISDGNYGDLRSMIFERVETVIVLALPWRVMAWRTLKRTVRRFVTREELWNGNRESVRSTIFSRDSVVYDLYHRRKKFTTFAEVAEAETPGHIRLMILRSARELDELYAEYGLIRR
jgi:adenylate kinase family enzyme